MDLSSGQGAGADSARPLKAAVQAETDHLITTVLGPAHIKPPPAAPRFSYMAALTTKWWRHYFSFVAMYVVPGPNALVPSFTDPFARLEYVGGDRFHLAFRRHTEEWVTVYQDQTLGECLTAISDDPWFIP